MSLNRYNMFRCDCEQPAVGAYSDNTAKPDGTYRMTYACQTHFGYALRRLKLWEVESYDLITNEQGMTYMRLKENAVSLADFLAEPEQSQVQAQVSLF